LVKLRLRRAGRKKRPFYRIVAADSRAPRDGRFIELVGTYDPLPEVAEVDFKEERIIHWLQNGAQPTATVKNLLQNKGIWLKWTLIKKGADDAKIAEELAKWETVQEEKLKRLALKREEAKSKKAKAKTEETAAEENEAPAEEASAPEKTEVAPAEEAAAQAPEVAETAAEEQAEEKAPAEGEAEEKN
jgi:small subunit ribosomal protein S16